MKRLWVWSLRVLMRILQISPKPLKINSKWDVWQSSAYMCITFECAKYLYKMIREEKRLTDYFRFTYAPDELMLATIIFNSPYKEHAIEEKGVYKGLKYLSAITYFNYGQSIQVFTERDYDELKESGMMFARKMESGISDSLMDRIDIERGGTYF
ncbi:MAG: hypothetical protein NC388_08105 [Clostridium sp.]|nr:hypothetical protein [Clostridium sp.]